jgi:hypothetical protein
MRVRAALLAGLIGCAAGSCNLIPGAIAIRIEWTTVPKSTSPLFAYARVEKRTNPQKPGTILQSAGPAMETTTSGAHLQFSNFPNGNDLVVVVEMHASQAASSPVLYDGVSEPFSLQAGVSRTITVKIGPVPGPPDTSTAGHIVYARNPWGSKATGGRPAWSVAGQAGAVAPGTTVEILDGPDPLQASILGSTVADSTGAFTIDLSTQTDFPTVYAAILDPAGNPSSVAAVHDVSWTATFNGRTPGNATVNPNTMMVEPGADLAPGGSGILFGARTIGASLAQEVTTYSGLASGGAAPGDGVPLVTTFEPQWLNVTPSTSVPPLRAAHVLAYDAARGVTVLFGGCCTSAGAFMNDTWEWDGATWTERFPTVSPPERESSAMVYDSARGVMVLFGGIDDWSTSFDLFGDTWTWDGSSWTEMQPGESPQARWQHAMSYDSRRGVTVLFGGDAMEANTACPVPDPAVTPAEYLCGDTWEWDGATWIPVDSVHSPPPMSGHVMAYDAQTDSTVLFSGEQATGDSGETWGWSGLDWQDMGSGGPIGRVGADMIYDARRGALVLFGGASAGGDGGVGGAGCTTAEASGGFVCGDTWEWHGRWTLASAATSPAARHIAAAAYDSGRGETVLLGGLAAVQDSDCLIATGQVFLCNDTWTWDGRRWTDVAQLGIPPTRLRSVFDYDSERGVSILFGGSGCSDFNCSMLVNLNDTWEWSGRAWRQLSVTGPSGRFNAATAYDSTRGAIVVFGGSQWLPDGSTVDLNDTWEWNGSEWNEVNLCSGAQCPSTPTPRADASMVYDASRGVTLLFGGQVDTTMHPSYLDDTWTWDGTRWTALSPTESPSGRSGASMAFDSVRGVAVLFGGSTCLLGCGPVDDTWEWTGNNWAQMFPEASPSARLDYAMDYDSGSGLVILQGGATGIEQFTGDTWAWDGKSWTQLSATQGPGTLAGASMAYDSGRARSVLFGGNNAPGALTETWILPSDPGSVPLFHAQFDLGAMGEPYTPAMIQQVSFDGVAGGSGPAGQVDAGSAATPGAALAVWDVSEAPGAWRMVATNTADSAAPGPLSFASSSVSEAGREVVGSTPPTLSFAVFPVQAAAAGSILPVVSVGDVELTVDYRHSESPCALSGGSSCECAADEIACGPEGGLFCSAPDLDPRNCGGCSTDGGVACGEGMACQGGHCACPGAETLCGGFCTDTSSDVHNCGACGTSCQPGALCTNGTCPQLHGRCGIDADCLAYPNTPVCQRKTGTCVSCTSNSDCVCPFGVTDAGACAAPGTPFCSSSGACVQCLGDGNCANGICISGTCESCPDAGTNLEIGCGGHCTNAATDRNNCGACGMTCGAGHSCSGGVCQ